MTKEGRIVFHDSVEPIPVDAGPAPQGLMVQPAEATDRTQRVTLHFSLAMQPDAAASLEEKIASGETVSPGDLDDYGASEQAVNALVDWLRSEGFEIEEVVPDHTSVYASASVAQV